MIPSRELALPGTPATVGQLQHQSSETFLQPTHFWSHRVSRGGRRVEDARILTLTQLKNHFSLNKPIDFLIDTLWLSGKHLDQLGQTADPKAFSINVIFFFPWKQVHTVFSWKFNFRPSTFSGMVFTAVEPGLTVLLLLLPVQVGRLNPHTSQLPV